VPLVRPPEIVLIKKTERQSERAQLALCTFHTFSARIITLLFFGRTWGVPFFVSVGTKGEAPPHTGFTVRFDNPTNAVRENGTVGDEGKAASRRHTLAALLFVQTQKQLTKAGNATDPSHFMRTF